MWQSVQNAPDRVYRQAIWVTGHFIATRATKTMNAMGHEIPTMVGCLKSYARLVTQINNLIPD